MKRDLNLIRRIIDCVFVRPISAVQCICICLGGGSELERAAEQSHSRFGYERMNECSILFPSIAEKKDKQYRHQTTHEHSTHRVHFNLKLKTYEGDTQSNQIKY